MDDIEEELDCYILANVLSDHKKIVKQSNLGTYIDIDGKEIASDQIIIEDLTSENIDDEDDGFLYSNDNIDFFEGKIVVPLEEDNSEASKISNLLRENESVQQICDSLKDSLINQLKNIQNANEEYGKLISKARSHKNVISINPNNSEKTKKDKELAWSTLSKEIFFCESNGAQKRFRGLPVKSIWTPEDQLKLVYGIKNDVIGRQIAKQDKDLQKKCDFFERKLRKLKSKTRLKIEECDLKLKYIKALKVLKKEYLKKNVSELIGTGDNQIDWLKIAIQEFDDYRTADECETIWERFLHPKFNTSEWTEGENKILIALVEKYKKQNWEKIAQELNTGRSTHSCFTHYQINLKKRFSPPWSTEEEDLLKKIVPLYTFGENYIQWAAVASFFPKRTRHQVYIHFTQSLKRFNKWTIAEDITLIAASRFVGPYECNLTQYLKQRSTKSIGQRWRNNLMNTKRKKNTYFSKEDDQDLWKFGNQYNFCLDKIQPHFNEYPRNAIHKRLMILKKFSNLNSGKIKFENIPRKQPKEKPFLMLCLSYARMLIRSGIKQQIIHKKVAQYIERNSNMKNWDFIKKLRKNNSEEFNTTIGIRQFLQCQYYPNVGRERKYLNTTHEINQSEKLTKFWMKSLQTKLKIPNNITAPKIHFSNERIENDVFSKLTRSLEIGKFPKLNMVPPTFPTLVGFRTLLLNRSTLQNSIIKDSEKPSSLSEQDFSVKTEIAKDMLLNRMRSMFLAPAFMSAISPSNIVNTEDQEEIPIERSKIMRTYSKKASNVQADTAVQQHVVNVNIQRNHLNGGNTIVQTNSLENPSATRKVIYISPSDVQDKISQLINEKKIDASKIIVINQLKNNDNNTKLLEKNIKTYTRKKTSNSNQTENPPGSLNIETLTLGNTSDTENACQLFQEPSHMKMPEIRKQIKHGHNKKRMAPTHLIEKQREIKKRRLEESGLEEMPKPKRTYVKTGIYSKKNDKDKRENIERRSSVRLSKSNS